MNIFVLNSDPKLAAKDMCNKHIVKMVVESTQILSTAFRLKMEERYNIPDCFESYRRLYRATHKWHPAVHWTKESVHNTDWLWQHANALYDEYTQRYRKHHKTGLVLNEFNGLRWLMWHGLGDWEQHTPFVQCMPETYKSSNAVTSYRQYYIAEKAAFAKWQPRASKPDWWPFDEM